MITEFVSILEFGQYLEIPLFIYLVRVISR